MPIEEYVKEKPCLAGKRVLIEVKSTQDDMTGLRLFAVRSEEDVKKLMGDLPDSSEGEYSLVTEGRLVIEDDRVELSYEESAIEGVEGCRTVISFETCDPLCVSVQRKGEFSSEFVIAHRKRIFGVYSTPFGALDMCVYAKKVDNTIAEDGGSLSLDYAVELRGLTAQRTRMEVKVKELSQ